MTRSPLPFVLAVLALGLMAADCSDGPEQMLIGNPPTNASWVPAAVGMLADTIPDTADDHDPSQPPYLQPVDYAPTDVMALDFGADASYLYVRVAYDAVIPRGPVQIQASGEVEAQTVIEQSFSFVIDTDNNDMTGAGASNFLGSGGMQGVDIFFGISLRYGGPVDVYANYDFAAGDIHMHGGQVIGELGAGGPGHDYILVRYPVNALGNIFWPAGITVEVGGWSEAESTLYHEFSNDFLASRTWTIPS